MSLRQDPKPVSKTAKPQGRQCSTCSRYMDTGEPKSEMAFPHDCHDDRDRAN